MSAMRRMKPIRDAFLPAQTASKTPEIVQIAFEIGELIFARSLVDVFFAGFSGRSDGEHGGLDGFGAVEPIVTGDLEQTHVPLAMVEVPLDGRGHGDEARGF